jgi:hypothetical protein
MFPHRKTTSTTVIFHYITPSGTNQGIALYIIRKLFRCNQAAEKCTLMRDEMQGRFAALDDMHHASRGDDIPSLWLG